MRESALAQLDTWLSSVILRSKTQAASEKKKKREQEKKNREKALNIAKSNATKITHSPRRRYQTRQQQRHQETHNTIINTTESISDSITSSEVSSNGDPDSNSSSTSQYGEEEDSIYREGSISLGNTIIT